MNGLRILFFGSPDFAVPSLRLLLENGYDVAAVVTAPDKPAGRGMQLQQTAVKQFALQQNLTILQPEKLKSEKFHQDIQALEADLNVVVAFRMLPEVVWKMPPLGSINLHASLLPDYRGAAPINWAIMNGEKETGVTTFFLAHEIDTGKIILREKTVIREEESAGELHDRLKSMGAELVLKTVRQIETMTFRLSEQGNAHDAKKAPRIFTETCRIHWNKNSREILNLIRGLSPYPGAFTQVNGKSLKIFSASILMKAPGAAPGTIRSDNETYLHFACADGWVAAEAIQMEGKKRMNVEEFLRGYKVMKE